MRRLYIFCLAACLSISISLAQDINGKWTGQMQSPNGPMDLTFHFKTNGDSLNGTVSSPMGELPMSHGKINGKTFSFDVNAGDFTINHQCTMMTDSISMKVPGMQGDTMVIMLKRVPESNKDTK